MLSEALELLTDLQWIEAKLLVTGPSDLLSDYIVLKSKQLSVEVIIRVMPSQETIGWLTD